MLGLFFIVTLLVIAAFSKLRSDFIDYSIKKERQDDWTFERDPVAVYRKTHEGDVDLFTDEKVFVYRDKNNHVIKKHKNGEMEDVTAKVNEINSEKRIREVFEKGVEGKYIEYDSWGKQNTLKEGVYGRVYVDRNDVSKKYVRRVFKVKIDDIYSSHNMYMPRQKVNIKHTGYCKYNYFLFCCLMDIENGKLIGLTDESEKWIEDHKDEKIEEVRKMINDFIEMFNKDQDGLGFFKTRLPQFVATLSEEELYYCSDSDFAQ